MFKGRIALAFGLLPSQVDEISASDYDFLARLWQVEPWGPWRDNFHAALLAAVVRAPNLKKGAKNLLSDFMLKDPLERQQQSAESFVQFLKAIAKKRKRK